MPGLYTGASGLWGGFAGLLYGSTSLSTPPGLLADAAGFSPSSLFANGEQGVWYQNSDFSTLFQDAAGTTPVTALEQPVGLRLDKSKGLVLGATELVSNGTFGANITGWAAQSANVTISWDASAALKGVTAASSGIGVYTDITTVAGKWYFATARIKANTDQTYFEVWNGDYGSRYFFSQKTTSGSFVTFSGYFLAIGTSTRVAIAVAASGQTFYVDDVSVRELPGNHAFQSTNSARPVLSARVNLLTQTEDFSAAAWAKQQVSSSLPVVTANQDIAPDGTLTADKVDFGLVNVAGGFSIMPQLFSSTATLAYSGSIYVKAATGSDVGKKLWVYLYDDAIVSLTPVVLTASYQRVSLTGSLSAGGGRQFTIGTIGSTYGGENQSAVSAFIWGADLRAASESSALPAYQRVGAATYGSSTSVGNPDYDTVGFPPYLVYDGGDWMQTNSINFSTGATNPPLGPELVVNGGPFVDTSGWTATSCTLSVSSAKLRVTATSLYGRAVQGFSTVIGRWYKFSANVYPVSGTFAPYIQKTDNADGGGNPVISGSQTSGTISIYAQATATTTYISIVNGQPSGSVVDWDGITVKELTNTNYLPDKMSVFAGVRKLSDASRGILVELSTSYGNVGSFGLEAPSGNLINNYQFVAGGSIPAAAVAVADGIGAPVTNIITGLDDISGDSVIIRADAVQRGSSNANQGTGNFGNYPLYIGARAGTGLFFNGRDYGFVIVGRAVTASELTNTEDYMDVQTFGKNMTLVYSDELTTALGELITAADGDQIYMTVQYI